MSTRGAAALLVLAVGRVAAAAEPEATAPAMTAPVPVVTPLVALEPLAPAEDRRAPLAPLAGALTVAAPFVAGCVLWAQNDHIGLQEAGTAIMLSGFAAAPWVANGLQRRWRRAAVFGGISAATSAATLVYMTAYKDPFEPGYRNIERVPFGMLLTSALFASAAGVVDGFLVASTTRREAP